MSYPWFYASAITQLQLCSLRWKTKPNSKISMKLAEHCSAYNPIDVEIISSPNVTGGIDSEKHRL